MCAPWPGAGGSRRRVPQRRPIPPPPAPRQTPPAATPNPPTPTHTCTPLGRLRGYQAASSQRRRCPAAAALACHEGYLTGISYRATGATGGIGATGQRDPTASQHAATATRGRRRPGAASLSTIKQLGQQPPGPSWRARGSGRARGRGHGGRAQVQAAALVSAARTAPEGAAARPSRAPPARGCLLRTRGGRGERRAVRRVSSGPARRGHITGRPLQAPVRPRACGGGG